MGLPAVVTFPMPCGRRGFKDGQTICVRRKITGWVGRAIVKTQTPSKEASAELVKDPADTHVPFDAIPPGAGKKDRIAGRVSGFSAIIWSIYLLGFFLLPAKWIYGPTMAALDLLLWPAVRLLGKPGAVAALGAGLAGLTQLVQKAATDNRRLLEAKRRAAALQKQAANLPTEAPRRTALLRLAAPVQLRTLIAAMVPIGLLLGPLVMPFVWFKQRVDPSVWNAPPGSSVQIVASIDASFNSPVSLEVPPGVAVDQATPVTRTLPAIRPALEHLLALYRQQGNTQTQPWELQVAPDLDRVTAAKDLQRYLDAGIPAQGITWTIRPAETLSGRFPVMIRPAASEPITAEVVLGDESPPADRATSGPPASPVRQVRVVYPASKVQSVFWQPLPSIHVSWLWVYILAYVPVLLLARAALKVA